MSNPYYSNTGYPQFRAPGKSEDMRAELKRIEGGMERLPDPIMPNQPVFGNASGTGMMMKDKESAKALLDLDKVDNTSDADKPISTETAAALATKADAAETTAALATKADKDEIAANLPNVTTAGADKIVVTNSSGDGWDYVDGTDKLVLRDENGTAKFGAPTDPEHPMRLGDISLRENVKVTVGAGGDFPTINAAVLYLSRFTPDHGVTAEVELQSGFVMMEQLFVEGLVLGWITITGVDAETVINEPSLTRSLFANIKPAFGVMRGTLPTIGQLFSFSSKGSVGDLRSGVLAQVSGNAYILEGCGVKNAGYNGIHAGNASTISAKGAIASGAGSSGVAAYGSSRVYVAGVDASGAGNYGIAVGEGSIISADGATGTLSQAKNTVTSAGIIFQP